MKLLLAASFLIASCSAVAVQHDPHICGTYQWWDEANQKCKDCPNNDDMLNCWLKWDNPTDPNENSGGSPITDLASPDHTHGGDHYCGVLQYFDPSCNCCRNCTTGSTSPRCMLSPGPTFPTPDLKENPLPPLFSCLHLLCF